MTPSAAETPATEIVGEYGPASLDGGTGEADVD